MLNRMIAQANTIAIGGHERPDGDCTGSCMGLYLYILENYSGKTVDIYLEQIPRSYQFLKRSGEIRHEAPKDQKYDLFICLDCGDKERLGFSQTLFEQAAHTLCVDHHISNKGFGEENYVVPDASSTSELIYDLIDKEKITLPVAEALYLGIVHDTGVFQYSCASPATLRAAADLMERGVDAPALIRKTYVEKSYAQNQVLGRALMESILFMDGRCIASYIRRREMEFYGVEPKALDGIVSHLRDTKGVEVAVFMYELKPSVYKVSLRSKEQVDVSRIAQYLGGGGHKRAAGFTMAGTPHDVLNNLSGLIEDQLGEPV
ncbi:bifunctional oligoribonuclease/PAP phosphatase NrnA [Lachnospiraceae bacterium KGMB03038]|nr:bifunctional oligoribonuclease/PAP phosphatase NrnA [Lachnospiraceae bacterium KGMB03038]